MFLCLAIELPCARVLAFRASETPSVSAFSPRQHFLYFFPLPHGHGSFLRASMAYSRWEKSIALHENKLALSKFGETSMPKLVQFLARPGIIASWRSAESSRRP